ncbi:hypothetical protein RchiOBHm_Chr5g0017471 [Rosa chinensis]|uniref:Uncharacterized protein n=1 Tax=Rosa chinensis TaxID=74649 RepID=A0A2P6Q6G8_ROSCH|nr:hypothetical protein RchiOBHm_Chr5g0017471 [Rosa chinensis]
MDPSFQNPVRAFSPQTGRRERDFNFGVFAQPLHHSRFKRKNLSWGSDGYSFREQRVEKRKSLFGFSSINILPEDWFMMITVLLLFTIHLQ